MPDQVFYGRGVDGKRPEKTEGRPHDGPLTVFPVHAFEKAPEVSHKLSGEIFPQLGPGDGDDMLSFLMAFSPGVDDFLG
ncbi:hypothetical protein SDC9_191103 [bioreactor metagenome]|uniref:Uncharacterized protein n=1 Tax=bioreactor metagenome TaxID=1076179 RepID=A0A645I7Z1_9ZZZZ